MLHAVQIVNESAWAVDRQECENVLVNQRLYIAGARPDSCSQGIVQRALQENHNHQGLTAKALDLICHQLRGLIRKHKLGTRETCR